MSAEEMQKSIHMILDDTIRFGCAIGSWSTDRNWSSAAIDCIRAVRDSSARQIIRRLKEDEENLCHACGQVKEQQNDH